MFYLCQKIIPLSSLLFSRNSSLAFSFAIFVFKIPIYYFLHSRQEKISQFNLSFPFNHTPYKSDTYLKYFVSDIFIFDFALCFLWNILNCKRIKVKRSVSINKYKMQCLSVVFLSLQFMTYSLYFIISYSLLVVISYFLNKYH